MTNEWGTNFLVQNLFISGPWVWISCQKGIVGREVKLLIIINSGTTCRWMRNWNRWPPYTLYTRLKPPELNRKILVDSRASLNTAVNKEVTTSAMKQNLAIQSLACHCSDCANLWIFNQNCTDYIYNKFTANSNYQMYTMIVINYSPIHIYPHINRCHCVY